MSDITKNDCLLKQVEEQEKIARQFGFYWERFDQLIEQIQSECKEVQQAWQKNDRENLQEEIGDLLQAAACLAVFCELDPQETLRKSVKKFQRRYDNVVKLAQSEGYSDLKNQPFELLISYWKRAKKL